MIFTNYKTVGQYDALTFKADGGLELVLYFKDDVAHSIEDEYGVLVDAENKTTLANTYIKYDGNFYTLLHVLNAGELALPDIKAEDEQTAREHDGLIQSMSNPRRYI